MKWLKILKNSVLDEILLKFYFEVRTENGVLYKKSSLTSIHHVHISGYIIEFKSCNKTIVDF